MTWKIDCVESLAMMSVTAGLSYCSDTRRVSCMYSMIGDFSRSGSLSSLSILPAGI